MRSFYYNMPNALMLYNCTYYNISVSKYCSMWCTHSNIICLTLSCYITAHLHKNSVIQRYVRLEFHGPPPDGRTIMRTFEFHRPTPRCQETKYRELCFLRGTIWACNMVRVYLRALYVPRNKPRFFSHTVLTNWFLKACRGVFAARYGLGL
jgi:hypothetical protein